MKIDTNVGVFKMGVEFVRVVVKCVPGWPWNALGLGVECSRHPCYKTDFLFANKNLRLLKLPSVYYSECLVNIFFANMREKLRFFIYLRFRN